MSPRSSITRPEWEFYERHIADVLKLAGYRVERDTLTGGGQSDILAIKTSGPTTTRILVECKHSKDSKPVSIDLVENFANRVMLLRSNDMIDNGIMVTNSGYSRFAKSVPTGSYVQLMTTSQLYAMIFDFELYLKELAEGSVQAKLETVFVRPFMSEYEYGKSNIVQISETDTISDCVILDMVDYCDDWLASTDMNRICLLGEYGTGKTTFCKWYASHRAKLCLGSSVNEPVPILIPLHHFTKSLDVDSLVTDYLVNKCKINNFRLEAFYFLLEQGRFLLLLDGFDEMARHVDREVRYQAITELSKLAKGKSKIILTGRPSFFPTDEELAEALGGSEQDDLYVAARNAYNEIIEYKLYEVKSFTRNQIIDFINKHTQNKTKTSQVITYIDSRYGVYDLVTRPVMLEMVVKSLPKLLELSPNKAITAGVLYGVYTGLWIDRELLKGEFRKLIKKEDKLRFMEELAYQLFLEDKISISYRQLGPPIKQFFKINDSDVDFFSHDIRTCSFLHRIPHQGYCFAHRSFQEYFVAKKLVHAVKAIDASVWKVRHIPPEIIHFASDLLLEENQQTKTPLLEWATTPGESILRSNAIIVALLTYAELPAKLITEYGMRHDVLQAYASYKIGDDTASSSFLEYLYNSIVAIARNYKSTFCDPLYFDDTECVEYDLAGDVLYKCSKLLRQSPIMTSKAMTAYLQGLVLNEITEICKTRYYKYSKLVKDMGVPRIETYYESDDSEFKIDEIPDETSTVEQSIEEQEIRELCFKELKHDEIELIDYFYYKDMSVDDIAKIINRNPYTVRARLKRALTKLRNVLSE